jgi:predicted tellurium resistance membrane protein TerC
MELLTDPHAWLAFLTLSALEIVLGIDNVVFISILVSRMDEKRGRAVRQFGLLLALIMRIIMLFGLTWLISLRDPVATVLGNSFSWHDVILIAGGLFLIAKATHEIHHEIEPTEEETHEAEAIAHKAFGLVVAQVVAIDLIFSIDSIITAIGMVQDIRIMIAAVLVSIAAMYFASGSVAAFIAKHPTTKMLALAFLVLIGVALLADGFEFHIPRGYIYFAMAFATAVETVNILARRKGRAVKSRAKKAG